MKQTKLWTLAALLGVSIASSTGASCSNVDNNTVVATADTTALHQWQAGAVVSQSAVDAFGGVDRCFAVEEE